MPTKNIKKIKAVNDFHDSANDLVKNAILQISRISDLSMGIKKSSKFGNKPEITNLVSEIHKDSLRLVQLLKENNK